MNLIIKGLKPFWQEPETSSNFNKTTVMKQLFALALFTIGISACERGISPTKLVESDFYGKWDPVGISDYKNDVTLMIPLDSILLLRVKGYYLELLDTNNFSIYYTVHPNSTPQSGFYQRFFEMTRDSVYFNENVNTDLRLEFKKSEGTNLLFDSFGSRICEYRLWTLPNNDVVLQGDYLGNGTWNYISQLINEENPIIAFTPKMSFRNDNLDTIQSAEYVMWARNVTKTDSIYIGSGSMHYFVDGEYRYVK
jgi:hypothetical protein